MDVHSILISLAAEWPWLTALLLLAGTGAVSYATWLGAEKAVRAVRPRGRHRAPAPAPVPVEEDGVTVPEAAALAEPGDDPAPADDTDVPTVALARLRDGLTRGGVL
jgi:hypothetical protein